MGITVELNIVSLFERDFLSCMCILVYVADMHQSDAINVAVISVFLHVYLAFCSPLLSPPCISIIAHAKRKKHLQCQHLRSYTKILRTGLYKTNYLMVRFKFITLYKVDRAF